MCFQHKQYVLYVNVSSISNLHNLYNTQNYELCVLVETTMERFVSIGGFRYYFRCCGSSGLLYWCYKCSGIGKLICMVINLIFFLFNFLLLSYYYHYFFGADCKGLV